MAALRGRRVRVRGLVVEEEVDVGFVVGMLGGRGGGVEEKVEVWRERIEGVVEIRRVGGRARRQRRGRRACSDIVSCVVGRCRRRSGMCCR